MSSEAHSINWGDKSLLRDERFQLLWTSKYLLSELTDFYTVKTEQGSYHDNDKLFFTTASYSDREGSFNILRDHKPI